MNFLTAMASSAFAWTCKNSFQVTPLILLVVFIQKLLGTRLSAGLRYWLSFVVLIGLLLPVILPSPFSLGNLFPAQSLFDKRGPTSVSPAGQAGVVQARGLASKSRHADSQDRSVYQVASLIWLSGVLCLLVVAVCRHRKWQELIQRGRSITEPSVLHLLEQAKISMGVQRSVALMAVDRLSSPAVYGVRRVHLLLPEAVLRELSLSELRLVFMHELAHVRRNDLLLNWVLMIVQFLHWFNPLVWWALHRLRADCELVCDAMILKTMEPGHRLGYGQVLLKLTEGFCLRTRDFSSAIPVVGSQRELRRRIIMIKHYREPSQVARVATVVLAVALGCVTLTRAKVPETKTDARVAGPLVINIDAEGHLRLAEKGEVLTIEQLKTQLVSEAKRRSGFSVHIRADHYAPWGQVVQVMDAAKGTGIGRADLQTEAHPH